MTDKPLSCLETPEGAYAVGKALAALATLHDLFLLKRDGLGSVATIVAGTRELLSEIFSTELPAWLQVEVSQRLEAEDDAIEGSLCPYPCPDAVYTRDYAGLPERTWGVTYPRIPLPGGPQITTPVITDRVPVEIYERDLETVRDAIQDQNPDINVADLEALADIALREDYRGGFRPTPRYRQFRPARPETAAA